MQDFYKLILDNLTGVVLLLDKQLMLRYVNPAGEMLFEISAKRIQGEKISSLIRDQETLLSVIVEAQQSGHSYTKREAQMMLGNGRELATDFSVTPLPGDEAGLLLIEFFPRDRLMRIGREEDARNQRETSRGLIRGLAHEIKNPLGGIRGAAQLLERALPDDSLEDYTQVIIGEADRLQKLVDRMLGPRKVPLMQPLNIHLIIERVFNLVHAETAGSISLIRDYDPSIPELEGDKEQLIQVVLNIVRNGVQALQESNTPNPEIVLQTRALRQFTLGAERHRLVCAINIVDNGPGIPEALKETLFYPMISGRAEGSGLGLSIAQSIINQHQGIIECQSDPRCTKFRIYIPLEQNNEIVK